jgi:hypothetical protein
MRTPAAQVGEDLSGEDCDANFPPAPDRHRDPHLARACYGPVRDVLLACKAEHSGVDFPAGARGPWGAQCAMPVARRQRAGLDRDEVEPLT